MKSLVPFLEYNLVCSQSKKNTSLQFSWKVTYYLGMLSLSLTAFCTVLTVSKLKKSQTTGSLRTPNIFTRTPNTASIWVPLSDRLSMLLFDLIMERLSVMVFDLIPDGLSVMVFDLIPEGLSVMTFDLIPDGLSVMVFDIIPDKQFFGDLSDRLSESLGAEAGR
jgi:hypothetical protein